MRDGVVRGIGAVLIAVGVLGALGGFGEANPLAIVSTPLFNLAGYFLSPTATILLWVMFVILGLTLVGPKEGYMRTIREFRR